MSTVLTIWTITWGTKDYGERYVARPHHCSAGNVSIGSDCLVADTLDGIRALLPPGLTRMPREPEDDAVIVESWL